MRIAVERADLEKLPVLHEILARLSDPAVSAAQLGRIVEQFPVLANRVRIRARELNRMRPTAGESIAVLGNRGFEAVLLELLEDLTVYRAEHGEGGVLPELVLDRQDGDERRRHDVTEHRDSAGSSMAPVVQGAVTDG
jgi:hypothetical protein